MTFTNHYRLDDGRVVYVVNRRIPQPTGPRRIFRDRRALDSEPIALIARDNDGSWGVWRTSYEPGWYLPKLGPKVLASEPPIRFDSLREAEIWVSSTFVPSTEW